MVPEEQDALHRHVLEEATPSSQTNVVGAAMRFYEHMQAPGIDILCEPNANSIRSSRPPRCCDRWAASGCSARPTAVPVGNSTLRATRPSATGRPSWCQSPVQHLSWYTMGGEAKRDYPASIFYQSPWWTHYAEVEDYFARVHVLTTRGQPVREVLVIHPSRAPGFAAGGVAPGRRCQEARRQPGQDPRLVARFADRLRLRRRRNALATGKVVRRRGTATLKVGKATIASSSCRRC